MEKTISFLHSGKIGKVSDKWESYLHYYDKILKPRQNSPSSLLEIGVQNGGSHETWASYFKSGNMFIGFDIDPKCGELKYDDARIRIVVGDAN